METVPNSWLAFIKKYWSILRDNQRLFISLLLSVCVILTGLILLYFDLSEVDYENEKQSFNYNTENMLIPNETYSHQIRIELQSGDSLELHAYYSERRNATFSLFISDQPLLGGFVHSSYIDVTNVEDALDIETTNIYYFHIIPNHTHLELFNLNYSIYQTDYYIEHRDSEISLIAIGIIIAGILGYSYSINQVGLMKYPKQVVDARILLLILFLVLGIFFIELVHFLYTGRDNIGLGNTIFYFNYTRTTGKLFIFIFVVLSFYILIVHKRFFAIPVPQKNENQFEEHRIHQNQVIFIRTRNFLICALSIICLKLFFGLSMTGIITITFLLFIGVMFLLLRFHDTIYSGNDPDKLRFMYDETKSHVRILVIVILIEIVTAGLTFVTLLSSDILPGTKTFSFYVNFGFPYIYCIIGFILGITIPAYNELVEYRNRYLESQSTDPDSKIPTTKSPVEEV